MSVANPSLPSSPVGQSLGQNDLAGTPLTPPDTHQSTAAAMMTRVVKGAHETIDHIAERATPPLEQLEQGLTHAGNVLHDKAAQWPTTADEWTESLRGSVREHPLVAVTAALAAGVLIASLVRSR